MVCLFFFKAEGDEIVLLRLTTSFPIKIFSRTDISAKSLKRREMIFWRKKLFYEQNLLVNLLGELKHFRM